MSDRRAFLLAVFFLLATARPALADGSTEAQVVRAGSLVVLTDTANQHLIVFDPAKRNVALYSTSGGLNWLGTRDVGADLSTRREDKTASAAAVELRSVPKQDAPGQDPPGFHRPPNAVRMESSYSSKQEAEEWSATYLVEGALADVYAGIQRSLADWKLQEETIQAVPPFPHRARSRLVEGSRYLEVAIEEDNLRFPDHVKVVVQLRDSNSGT